jgi:hypothetical protein
VGTLVGACTQFYCDDLEEQDFLVDPGTYLVEPKFAFTGATVEITDDEVSFDFVNADGAQTRVVYEIVSRHWDGEEPAID